jgi:hypothetical protein
MIKISTLIALLHDKLVLFGSFPEGTRKIVCHR